MKTKIKQFFRNIKDVRNFLKEKKKVKSYIATQEKCEHVFFKWDYDDKGIGEILYEISNELKWGITYEIIVVEDYTYDFINDIRYDKPQFKFHRFEFIREGNCYPKIGGSFISMNFKLIKSVELIKNDNRYENK